jgi:hypothetical protein
MKLERERRRIAVDGFKFSSSRIDREGVQADTWARRYRDKDILYMHQTLGAD